ncbi:Rab5-interacting protein (Rab5ip)-domain containing protein [Rhodotorula toruloides]|uniref:ER membrane protein complex subunit 6 n=1 Tax=Rhodotorula toruloides TaxID=5286 RepID=A0A2T0A043_RHOTO|nr:Rab5-interacting protein (Rab5ip)-domain containing protein [Rhodotorula toruloides]
MAAVAPPTAPTTSSGSPIFVPNLVHNQRALYYVKSTTACIAGSIAGILGLTNLHGFVLFFITSFGVGALYSAVNCGMKPGRYFPKAREPLLSGTLGNCFSFILFWTLFYSLVHSSTSDDPAAVAPMPTKRDAARQFQPPSASHSSIHTPPSPPPLPHLPSDLATWKLRRSG